MRCTENCHAYSLHWSTKRTQFSYTTTPDLMCLAQPRLQKLNKLGKDVLPHLPYSPDLPPTTTSSSILITFCRENASTTSACVCLVTQSCLTLCDPMDCSPSGSSVCGILQERILEWVSMPSSRGSSQLRNRTHVSYIPCIGRWVLYHQCHLEKEAENVFQDIVKSWSTDFYATGISKLISHWQKKNCWL